ncbi:hypothetical protein [Sporosarcina ureae]|uniref:hypothetical protein n=1 Tax=Sporosarcina ureae TaxID=1571 RepID=UPI0026F1CE02|nr:hypothetical protein [Sporosarcina ureae]
MELNTPLVAGQTSTVTVTTRDSNSDPISLNGYIFTYEVQISGGKTYKVNNVDYTIADHTNIGGTGDPTTAPKLSPTVNGITTFDIVMPTTLDLTDNIQIQVEIADATTDIGSQIKYK